MYIKFCLKLLFAMIVIAPAFVFGDQSNSDAIPNLIVSATRSEQRDIIVPANISVISHQMISESGAIHITDVLRGHGLQITDLFGDGSRVSVDSRGFGESAGSNTLVLVDGRRLNNADTGSPDLNSISLNQVERIEIVHGSSGILFGDQAVGGVINIITRQASSFEGVLNISTGSYNRHAIQTRVSNYISDNLSYSIGADVRQTDNYRQHNQQDYQNFFSRMNFNYSSGSVFLEYQMIDEDLQTPGALIAGEVVTDRRQSLNFFENDFSDTDTKVYRLGMNQTISEHWSLQSDLTQRKSDGLFLQNFRGCGLSPFFPCNNMNDSSHREQSSFTPRLVGAYPDSHGVRIFTIGADIDQHEFEINSLFVNTRNSRNAKSFYAHAVLPLSSNINLTGGLRTAKLEDDLVDLAVYPAGVQLNDDVTVSEIGFSYQLSKAWRMFARVDENYRFPKADEQTFTTVGIIGLETQIGDSVEWGSEWRYNRYALKFAKTELDLKNEIAFDPTANGPFGPFGGANINFNSTHRATTVLNGEYRFTDSLILSGFFTNIDAEFQSGIFQGRQISGVADRVFGVAVKYTPNDRVTGFLEAENVGQRFPLGDNANTQMRLPAYTVVNFSLSMTIENWVLTGRVNNLSNRDYVESANAFGALNPSPGRNYWFTLGYSFQ